MKLPLVLEGHVVRDAEGRVIISALNPCTDAERRQIARAVNATAKKRGKVMDDTAVKALKALMCVELRLRSFNTSGLHDCQVRWLNNTQVIAAEAIAECQALEAKNQEVA